MLRKLLLLVARSNPAQNFRVPARGGCRKHRCRSGSQEQNSADRSYPTVDKYHAAHARVTVRVTTNVTDESVSSTRSTNPTVILVQANVYCVRKLASFGMTESSRNVAAAVKAGGLLL